MGEFKTFEERKASAAAFARSVGGDTGRSGFMVREPLGSRGSSSLRESVAVVTHIRERTEGGGSPNVDRANAIVRNVRIIGGSSKNGRQYTESCLRSAIPLYEGCRVCVDHRADKGRGGRSPAELLGTLRSVHFKNGGLHGDLHLFESHPVAGIVMDAGERAPHTLGFSHDASGEEVTRNGRRVVESLEQVHSVDLVMHPATTTGLFESQQQTKQPTLPRYPADSKAFADALTGNGRRLLEMDGVSDLPAADQGAGDTEDVITLAELAKLLGVDATALERNDDRLQQCVAAVLSSCNDLAAELKKKPAA